MTVALVDLGADARADLVDLVVRGMYRGEVRPAQQSLVDSGFATARGPVLMPSQQGVAEVAQLLRLEAGSEDEQKVHQLFLAFLPINRRLREVCTDWQRLPDGSANDHTDTAWDAEVRDRLEDIDSGIGRIVRRLAALHPELASYRTGLTAALQNFDGGDRSALASPLSDSYHNVWMWLHQHLLLMLGISRAEDELLEEKLVSEQNA